MKRRNDKRPRDWKVTNMSPRQKASKMIASYKHKDKKNGTTICDMTIEWFIENIMTQPCFYCGDTKRIGADRLNNNKGHTKDNVVPCCYDCNCARNTNFTVDEMKIIGEAIKLVKSQRPQSKLINEVHDESEFVSSQEKHYDTPIYQYNAAKELVNIFANGDEACEKTGFKRKHILMACAGNRHNSHKYQKFYWYYDSTKIQGETSCFNNRHLGEVFQYDMNGNLVHCFPKLKAVLENGFDKNSVRRCCVGERYFSQGYFWSYTFLTREECMDEINRRLALKRK